jgi:periplasmic divalent cation tolerance protein
MVETSSEFCFVYSTFPDRESALAVARALIDRNLAACVNLSAPMTSLYRWEGKCEESTEIAGLIKTRRSLADAAIALARTLHPYSVPCFLVLPIEAGNGDYLVWARRETEQALSV